MKVFTKISIESYTSIYLKIGMEVKAMPVSMLEGIYAYFIYLDTIFKIIL